MDKIFNPKIWNTQPRADNSFEKRDLKSVGPLVIHSERCPPGRADVRQTVFVSQISMKFWKTFEADSNFWRMFHLLKLPEKVASSLESVSGWQTKR